MRDGSGVGKTKYYFVLRAAGAVSSDESREGYFATAPPGGIQTPEPTTRPKTTAKPKVTGTDDEPDVTPTPKNDEPKVTATATPKSTGTPKATGTSKPTGTPTPEPANATPPSTGTPKPATETPTPRPAATAATPQPTGITNTQPTPTATREPTTSPTPRPATATPTLTPIPTPRPTATPVPPTATPEPEQYVYVHVTKIMLHTFGAGGAIQQDSVTLAVTLTEDGGESSTATLALAKWSQPTHTQLVSIGENLPVSVRVRGQSVTVQGTVRVPTTEGMYTAQLARSISVSDYRAGGVYMLKGKFNPGSWSAEVHFTVSLV